MISELVDYPNGRYQGRTNNQQLRHGPGVLIDDDLTFFASNFQRDLLNGPTLIFLAHAQYIYG